MGKCRIECDIPGCGKEWVAQLWVNGRKVWMCGRCAGFYCCTMEGKDRKSRVARDSRIEKALKV
jgi:hypothetical protein